MNKIPKTAEIALQQMNQEEKIKLVSWSDMLDNAQKENETVDPKKIMKYNYKFLDEKLGGLFKGELTLVGGITGTGKSTFSIKLAEKQARLGKKVVIVALEERLTTRGRKAILYEVNRYNRVHGKKQINMVRYLTGHDTIPKEDEQRAIDIIKNDNIEYVACKETMTINDLEYLFKKKADLYIFDHLHYFSLHDKDKSKADSVEQSMQQIKNLTVQYDTNSILIAHFQKLDESKRPTMTNFKDSISIAQTADTVIMLWRDKSQEATTQYETEFIVPKNRIDAPAFTATTKFDINTNEYLENAETQIGTMNSYEQGNDKLDF